MNTNALKVFGAFAVIFAHVGYFIFTDHSLLAPFSNYGGVAVNIFFFLSAYGLALSFSKWEGNIKGYYVKRVLRIAPAIWISLALFFILDAFILSKFYGAGYILQSFFLIFPSANLYTDIDSPLWYITPLLSYYLVFPLLFQIRKPYLSALLFLVFGLILYQMPFIGPLYALHYLAFPLGILWAYHDKVITTFFQKKSKAIKYLLGILLLIIVYVTGTSLSGVGTFYEQYASIVTTLALIIFFIIIPVQGRIIAFLAGISFELYLLHWPFMYRYDVLHFLRDIPYMWLILWTLLLIGLSWILKRLLC